MISHDFEKKFTKIIKSFQIDGHDGTPCYIKKSYTFVSMISSGLPSSRTSNSLEVRK